MKSNELFFLPMDALTPSQLYISEEKLQKVREWFHGNFSNMEPLPVKKLAGRLLLTDGHTRAAAAFLTGLTMLPCVWDTDNLDWAAYAADINLCAEEGITSIARLAERIVSADDYDLLWRKRVDAMYDEWYYSVLTQKDEVIFFTRQPTGIPLSGLDIRPLDLGFEEPYVQLYIDGKPAVRGCIEQYSFEFWEAADIRTQKEFRGCGYGTLLTAWLTDQIVTSGKTATCRTLPENAAMNHILKKCGYQKLYEQEECHDRTDFQ